MPDLLKKALDIRFFSHISAHIFGIVAPLAIYNLTHSLTYAGISLFLEWAFKLFTYFYGGVIFSFKNANYLLKTTFYFRVLSLLALIFTLQGFGPWWVITIAAIAYQINSAIIYISFEVSISSWTSCSSSGHTKIIARDNWAGALGIAMGLIFHSLTILICIALVFLAISIYMQNKYGSALFIDRESKNPHISDFLAPWKSMKNMSADMWKLGLLCVLYNVPVAVIFPAMPFFMSDAFNTKEISTAFFSTTNLVRIFICASVLHLSLSYIKKYTSRVAFEHSLYVSLVCLAAMIFAPSYYFLAAMIGMGAFTYCMAPWIRETRQKLITDKSQAHELTGIMNAFTGVGFLIAGTLTALNFHPKTLIIISFLSLLLSFVVYLRMSYVKKSKHAYIQSQSTSS